MKKLRNFRKNDLGVAAILFALTVPLIIGAAGVGVDIAKAYRTKNKLEKTLDAAALAGATTNYSGDQLKKFITQYIENNFKDTSDSVINIGSLTIDQDTVSRQIKLAATADSTNSFMNFFGRDTVTVAATSVARKKLTGVEVVMVLDDSESMKFDNKSKDLQEASKEFIKTLYDSIVATGGEFKIGIVPYGSFVNVGPYGIGETLNGKKYASGKAFVNNPLKLKYTNSRNQNEKHPSLGWSGCVYEHDFYNTGNHDPNWDMYFFCHDKSGNRITDGNAECRLGHYTNTGYWDPEPTYGPWSGCYKTSTVDGIKNTYWDPTCKRDKLTDGNWVSTPGKWVEDTINVHKYCPDTIIQPLIESSESGGKGTLTASVAKLSGAGGAKTNSDVGMAWAYELLDPDFPFEEGADWDDPKWAKVIVFMTDGNIQADQLYGPYYPIDVNKQAKRTKRATELFEDQCKLVKSQGILIYTVQFEGSAPLDPANQNVLQSCASDSAKALKASNGAMLVETFKNIAEDLGNIYLAK